MPARSSFAGAETLLINTMMIGVFLATDLVLDVGKNWEHV